MGPRFTQSALCLAKPNKGSLDTHYTIIFLGNCFGMNSFHHNFDRCTPTGDTIRPSIKSYDIHVTPPVQRTQKFNYIFYTLDFVTRFIRWMRITVLWWGWKIFHLLWACDIIMYWLVMHWIFVSKCKCLNRNFSIDGVYWHYLSQGGQSMIS